MCLQHSVAESPSCLIFTATVPLMMRHGVDVRAGNHVNSLLCSPGGGSRSAFSAEQGLQPPPHLVWHRVGSAQQCKSPQDTAGIGKYVE